MPKMACESHFLGKMILTVAKISRLYSIKFGVASWQLRERPLRHKPQMITLNLNRVVTFHNSAGDVVSLPCRVCTGSANHLRR